MKRLILLCFLTLISGEKIAQQFNFVRSIGKFANASAFNINSSGHIYVVDSGSDEIYKLDTNGVLLKFGGGFGWDNGSFDDPMDVFATPLSVYVSDKNNHRIQRFDKDLNFISLLSTRTNENSEEHFGYPIGCVTSGQGDLFILDSENNRIIKFDLFGNFKQNFGGFEYGKFSLTKPTSIAVSASNAIFVIDDTSLIVFDSFGTGISRSNLGQLYRDIRIMSDNLTISSPEKIIYGELKQPELRLIEIKLLGYEHEMKIVSSILYKNKIYVLTPKQILVFE